MYTVQALAPNTAIASLRVPAARRQAAPSRAASVGARRAGVCKSAGNDGSFAGFSPEVTEIESVEQFDEILAASGDQLVVLNAGASWCGPCKLFRPTFDVLAVDYAKSHKVKFLYCVGDKNPSNTVIMKRLGIKNVPSFHLFRKAEQIAQFGGANKTNFIDKITPHL